MMQMHCKRNTKPVSFKSITNIEIITINKSFQLSGTEINLTLIIMVSSILKYKGPLHYCFCFLTWYQPPSCLLFIVYCPYLLPPQQAHLFELLLLSLQTREGVTWCYFTWITLKLVAALSNCHLVLVQIHFYVKDYYIQIKQIKNVSKFVPKKKCLIDWQYVRISRPTIKSSAEKPRFKSYSVNKKF